MNVVFRCFLCCDSGGFFADGNLHRCGCGAGLPKPAMPMDAGTLREIEELKALWLKS